MGLPAHTSSHLLNTIYTPNVTAKRQLTRSLSKTIKVEKQNKNVANFTILCHFVCFPFVKMQVILFCLIPCSEPHTAAKSHLLHSLLSGGGILKHFFKKHYMLAL